MTDWNKLTVVKLKEELRGRNLPSSGKKAELVARLEEAEANDAPAAIDKQQDDESGTRKTSATIRQDGPSETPIDPDRTTLSSQDVDKSQTAEDTVKPGEEIAGAPVVNATEDPPASEMLEPAPALQELPTREQPPFAETPLEVTAQPEVGDETIQHESTQASLNADEIVEDTRKRKRRSKSPPPSSFDTAVKKIKAQDGSPRVQFPEDKPSEQASEDKPMPDAPTAVQGLDGVGHTPGSRKGTPEADVQMLETVRTVEDEIEQANGTQPSPSRTSPADTRFKKLFNGPARTSAPLLDRKSHSEVEDRDLAPAVHRATSALYIKNFMRPLHPGHLKDHLSKLARAPNAEPDDEVITEFFLDTIKSHCLAQFSSISAASRVRLALHDRVWPDERTRKALWVDFIPEEKLQKWIDVEQEAAGGRGAAQKRWEVVYETEGDSVAAYLQEADLRAAPAISKPHAHDGGNNGTAKTSAPLDPLPTEPSEVQRPRGDPGKGFKALDELFRSTTTAKPKLYFQPVGAPLAQRRLDKLAEGRGGGRGDEMRRFSFEDDDVIVDRGPEFGYGRGARGRGGGHGHGGGYVPRGGYRGGDSWRESR